MGAIQDLFRAHGPAYLTRFGSSLPSNHNKVIEAIIGCASPANESLSYGCEACAQEQLLPRCCGKRHCPGCQQHKAYAWLDTQLQRQLPTHHFMLTFTVPEQLRPFIRAHQRIGYGALFEASAGAIKKLAPDPKYIGADCPGFLGVLHTWGRQLQLPQGALQPRAHHGASDLRVHAPLLAARAAPRVHEGALLRVCLPELLHALGADPRSRRTRARLRAAGRRGCDRAPSCPNPIVLPTLRRAATLSAHDPATAHAREPRTCLGRNDAFASFRIAPVLAPAAAHTAPSRTASRSLPTGPPSRLLPGARV